MVPSAAPSHPALPLTWGPQDVIPGVNDQCILYEGRLPCMSDPGMVDSCEYVRELGRVSCGVARINKDISFKLQCDTAGGVTIRFWPAPRVVCTGNGYDLARLYASALKLANQRGPVSQVEHRFNGAAWECFVSTPCGGPFNSTERKSWDKIDCNDGRPYGKWLAENTETMYAEMGYSVTCTEIPGTPGEDTCDWDTSKTNSTAKTNSSGFNMSLLDGTIGVVLVWLVQYFLE